MTGPGAPVGRRALSTLGALAILAPLLAVGPAAHAQTPDPSPSPSVSEEPDPLRSAQYWIDDLGVPAAWETTRGAGQRIAIIDTGIGRAPGLDGAVVGGTDVSGIGASDGRTPVGSVDGEHGTLVAELAAGRGTGEDAGVIGIAPEAELLSVSLGFGQTAAVPFAEQVAEGMRWAVDNGASVINLSFTTNTLAWDAQWDSAFQYAFDNDVVVVVAAGNRGAGTTTVGAPATIPGVLTVAGVTPEGFASEEASTQGITIGISAPSERLVGVTPDGREVLWDGTSGAAPIVAGVAALVRAAHPELDAANVINRIISTASPAAGATEVPDRTYGYGIVDASAAVSAPVAGVTANPMGDLAEWIRLYRRAPTEALPDTTPEPEQVEALPDPDPVSDRGSPLLPDEQTLVYGTVPLAAATAAGILVALGVTAAVRRTRSARARTPSR